jgi:hypothetical protein
MKIVTSVCAVLALAGVSLADCHAVSGRFNAGYGGAVALSGGFYAPPVVTVSPVVNVQAGPCDYAGDAGLGPVLAVGAGGYGYGGGYGRFVNAGFGGHVGSRFARGNRVQVVERVRVVNVRNVRNVRGDGTGVVGLARGVVGTVRNVGRALIGR